MFKLFLLFLFGYLLGSIPSGYLISKNKGVDIRKVGSGNIGGTNIARTFGLKLGIAVGILDVFKGIIPTYLAIVFLSSNWQIALVAVAPTLGHIFPVWLKFKGGKGVSTAFGALLVLLQWKYILILILIWISAIIAFKIVSFASLSAASFVPLTLWMAFHSLSYFVLGLVFFILIWWAHRENIERIKNKTESRFKFKKSSDNNK